MKFDSIEDLIEYSVYLNQKSIPFLEGLEKLSNVEGVNQAFRNELKELLDELSKFFLSLELHANEDGDITSNELEERKFH